MTTEQHWLALGIIEPFERVSGAVADLTSTYDPSQIAVILKASRFEDLHRDPQNRRALQTCEATLGPPIAQHGSSLVIATPSRELMVKIAAMLGRATPMCDAAACAFPVRYLDEIDRKLAGGALVICVRARAHADLQSAVRVLLERSRHAVQTHSIVFASLYTQRWGEVEAPRPAC
jgi:hypothetical protein